MPRQADKLLYNNAVKWINENPQDKSTTDPVQQEFLRFIALPPEVKTQLVITLDTLLKTTGLPHAIEASLPGLKFDAEGLPNELLFETGSHISNLLHTSGRMYSLFHPSVG